MGLFHIDYNKPGPGVRKDEPKKNAFIRFFAILFRKFTQLVELNLLFSVFAIIALAITYLLRNLIPDFLLVIIPILLISPSLAGLTFVTRNYAREEHAFLMGDFFDAIKQNWKMFLANGVVCILLYLVLSVSIRFYYHKLTDGTLYAVALCLCIAIALLLLFAQYYVPLMAVTFDLNLLQIYKNALIFAIIGLWRNILITILLAVLTLILYLSQIMALSLMIGIVFVLTLLFSFGMFLINFTIYPLVDKTMIQPYQNSLQGESDKKE
ncbi:DUF624 domain-containing protein [Caproicibacter sp.]|uniref:DUF624 domain-containing protein n=1 Tax=Caproicibacter sp. TaxID=2814884 RepID=UPI00398996A3